MNSSGMPFESQTPYSRLSLLLSGVLDSFSFSLFYLSFSSLPPVLHAIWYRFVTEDSSAIQGKETAASREGNLSDIRQPQLL
jgi:hypothetical protein